MAAKYQEEWLERDFMGYGFDKPDPRWPGGAKVCVSFVVQYYMGAESNPLDGDPTSCADFMEIPNVQPTPLRNEGHEQMYEFEGREGVPRLLKLFDKYKLSVTWNFFTMAMQKGAYWIKPILDAGAELSCGGHRYRDNFDVDPEEEEELIEKSIDIFRHLTGDDTQPNGWLVERQSNLSIKLYTLASKNRQIPLSYSSDSCADDLPYWIPSYASPDKSEGLLMIPFSYNCTDLRFNMRGSGWASPKDYFSHLKRSSALLRRQTRENRNRFIKYITERDAWVARRIDIADHWRNHFPYDPKTASGQGEAPPPCGQIDLPTKE